MVILNKTTKPRQRYRIIEGGMGQFGQDAYSPCHKYHIVSGIDRGNGYQGSMAIDYFFTTREFVPDEAKKNAVKFLLANGYGNWLAKKNLLPAGFTTGEINFEDV